MNKFFSALIFTAACSTSVSASANSGCPVFSTPYSADYFGSYKGWRLNTTQTLTQQDKNQWLFELRANNPIGTLTQQSHFSLNEVNQISAKKYLHHRKVILKNDKLNIAFDWKKKIATTTHNEKEYRLSLKGGELDELNYQLALRCDLLAGLNEFSYQAVERKKIDRIDFKIIGEEKIITELGTLDTVVVKRIRDTNSRSTTLWFAKELNYLMVKLLQEEHKDTEAYLLYIKTLHK